MSIDVNALEARLEASKIVKLTLERAATPPLTWRAILVSEDGSHTATSGNVTPLGALLRTLVKLEDVQRLADEQNIRVKP